jgi:hypothetical protein
VPLFGSRRESAHQLFCERFDQCQHRLLHTHEPLAGLIERAIKIKLTVDFNL